MQNKFTARMKKKILVTGGAGYIGSHTVVELFKSGYLPVIVDNMCNTSERNLRGINKILNTELPFHNVDCTDLKQMEDIFTLYEDIHACIHFAAYKSVEDSVKHPEKYYKNNIGSLETLLKCFEQTKFKNLIFSSSCTVYGMPDKLPVDERAPFKKAESPYGETKQKCELLIQNNKCNSVSLRYFNPIGSHDSGFIGDCSSDNASNLVPIVAEVAAGLRAKLTVNGNDYDTHDGTCVRDYIHVQDLAIAHVKALDYLLKHSIKEVFNVGTGHGLSVLDIVTAFEASNNLKLNYTIGDRRAGDVEKIYSDGAKIKKVLGWMAGRTTEEALISAWNWQKSTHDA
jgi:UDP-glucose 4-epimerase